MLIVLQVVDLLVMLYLMLELLYETFTCSFNKVYIQTGQYYLHFSDKC